MEPQPADQKLDNTPRPASEAMPHTCSSSGDNERCDQSIVRVKVVCDNKWSLVGVLEIVYEATLVNDAIAQFRAKYDASSCEILHVILLNKGNEEIGRLTKDEALVIDRGLPRELIEELRGKLPVDKKRVWYVAAWGLGAICVVGAIFIMIVVADSSSASHPSLYNSPAVPSRLDSGQASQDSILYFVKPDACACTKIIGDEAADYIITLAATRGEPRPGETRLNNARNNGVLLIDDKCSTHGRSRQAGRPVIDPETTRVARSVESRLLSASGVQTISQDRIRERAKRDIEKYGTAAIAAGIILSTFEQIENNPETTNEIKVNMRAEYIELNKNVR